MATTAKSKKTWPAEIDRPFDPAVLKLAREAAQRYTLILWQEEGEYRGSSIELPHCMGIGKTPDECIRETRELMVSALACDIEKQIDPPAPVSSKRRTEQINIRLSPLERKRLEIAAQAGGYHGVSDYVRDAALAAL